MALWEYFDPSPKAGEVKTAVREVTKNKPNAISKIFGTLGGKVSSLIATIPFVGGKRISGVARTIGKLGLRGAPLIGAGAVLGGIVYELTKIPTDPNFKIAVIHKKVPVNGVLKIRVSLPPELKDKTVHVEIYEDIKMARDKLIGAANNVKDSSEISVQLEHTDEDVGKTIEVYAVYMTEDKSKIGRSNNDTVQLVKPTAGPDMKKILLIAIIVAAAVLIFKKVRK